MRRYVLDARTITTHFPGIGRYVRNLVSALPPLLDPDEHLVVLTPPETHFEPGEQVEFRATPQSPFSIRQQWALPQLLNQIGAQVYHSPYYLMPYRTGIPTVLTIYDLIPKLYPQSVPAQTRLIFGWATRLAVQAAAHVITISETTRQDLISHLNLPPDKVSPIPLAVAKRFTPRPLVEVQQVQREYSLPEGFALYLGTNKPHKNLTRLVEAWASVMENWPQGVDQPTLVCAGRWDPRYPEPRARSQDLSLVGQIRFLGSIPESDLPALYSAASLFIFPSLYEGFGLPPLEAMACGTPVVCGDTSSLPEVVGNSAHFFDPKDVKDMAAAVLQLLVDPDHRARLSTAGLNQAAKFTWRQTAERTLIVYRSVIHT